MTYIGSLGTGQILYGRDGFPEARDGQARLVSSLNDLPTPVSGVITLPANTCWEFTRDVDISPNVLSLEQGSCLEGAVPGDTGVTTNSANPLISFSGPGTNGRAITRLSLVNNGGPVFNVSGSSLETLLIDTCVAQGTSLGVLQALGALFIRGLLDMGSSNGLELLGNTPYVRITEFVSLNAPPSYTGLRLGATLQSISVLISQSTVTISSPSITGLSIDPAVVVTRGLVSECQFPGSGVALSGITPGEVSWKFSGNQGVQDSSAGGDLRYFSPSFNVVPLANVWTALTGPGIAYNLTQEERFVFVAPDQVRYVGLDPINITVSVTVSCEKNGIGVNNQPYGVTVFKNDTATDGTNPAIGSAAVDTNQNISEVNTGQARTIPTTAHFKNVRNGDLFRVAAIGYSGGPVGGLECYAVAMTISEG